MTLASLRHSPSRLTLLVTLALGALGVVGIGCSSADAETPSKGPGYTECGDVTCAPGQHCAQPSISICEEGCLTDANCPTQQICDPDATTFRQCIGSSIPDPQPDSLAACKAACDHFQSCGLAAGEAAQCKTDCEGVTEDKQTVIGNCGEKVECSQVASCLGVQCISTNDCQNDQSCVGYACLGGA